MEQTKYLIGNILSLPLFPLLYVQGKRIKNTIPSLPEAKNPAGSTGNGTKKISLISIGESTIAGVGVSTHEYSLTGRLAHKLAVQLGITVDWKVVAKSGYTATKVTEKLVPTIDESKFEVIIIGLGGNDTFKLNTPKQWKRDIEALIRSLQEKFKNTPIIFINVPPFRSFPAFTKVIKFVLGRQIDLLHSTLKKVVDQQEQVWFIEERIDLKYWVEHFKTQQYTIKDFFSDGVHPSELTYEVWAGEVAKFIIEEQILNLKN